MTSRRAVWPILVGVGFDDAGRTVEVLVALTYAMLAIAARLATNADGVLS